MGHRDMGGIAVAIIAILLSGIAWLLDGAGLPAGRPNEVALERASTAVLESQSVDVPTVWHDRATGFNATIIPARAYQDDAGQWCRAYRVALTARNGKAAPLRQGIACRDGSGSWSPQSASEGATAQGSKFALWLARLPEPAPEQVAGR